MSLISKLKEFRLRAYISLYRLLPLESNKIILWADSFKHYGCSPKYLTEYLLKNRPGIFDIVWVFANDVEIPTDLPDKIRVVRFFSLKYLKELHTARFIVCNMRIGDSYMWHKRPGQKYIQTWHSSLRLKKIEQDAQAFLPSDYISSAIADSKNIDLLISGCQFSSKIFSRSFWYDGTVLNSGTPRCDIFFMDKIDDIRNKVCDVFNIERGKKIALYAPTFRNDKSGNLHNIDFIRIEAALKSKTGDNWVILYRFHPNLTVSNRDIKDAKNASSYSDMQELLAAADLLITDYSSCMFDMAVAHKPCLLYTPDIDNYMKSERGLYFNPETLPFTLSTDNDSLVAAIKDFDENEYLSRIDTFLASVGSFEQGLASKRITEFIEQNI